MRYLKYAQMVMLSMVLTCLLLHSPAQAITVTVDPVAQNVTLGNQATIGIMIYGYAPGPLVNLAVGGYDFSINYNPTILSFKSLSFGTSLGYPTDSNATYLNNPVSGILQISEYSDLSASELYALQGQQWPDDTFIAATITFNTLGSGVSPLSVDINSLLTEKRENFDGTYSDPGSLTVSSVPEPSTFLLLGAGIGGVALLRRKNRKP